MTDLRSLDAQVEQSRARPMSSAGRRLGGKVETISDRRDDEITRLREENERLRRGLREIRQLLEPPAPARPDAPFKVFPTIGLL